MKKIFALATLGLVVLLAACATPAPAVVPATLPQSTALPATAMAQPTALPQPTTALAADFPTGLYELKDTPARGLQFNKDNTFSVLVDGKHVVEGTYTTKDNVYTETSNSVGCPSQMDFTYTFDGVDLQFKPVADPAKDPCTGRIGDFNASKTWILRRSVLSSAADFPAGLYQLKDTPSRGLQFNKDNTFSVLVDGHHVVEGTYSAKDNVYTETSNSVGCPSHMNFTFTFDGTNLMFKPVADPAKDPCVGRVGDFNASTTWVLMPGAAKFAADFPAGLYQLKDTPARGLQFNMDHTFSVLVNGKHVAEGTYSAKDNVYTETSNSVGCPSHKDFTYTFDGIHLVFKPVADPAKDPCVGRVGDFNASTTWVLMPAAAAFAADFPAGLYQLKDTPARGLQFNEDHTFSVLADGKHVVEGTYSAKDNVYTETSNSVGCPSQMDFTYTFDGIHLMFKPVADPAKDPCDGRKADFNDAKTWVLTPAAATVAADFPTGLYQLKDTPACGLQFNKDHTFSVLADGKHVVEGTFSAKDNVYTETSNSVGCPSQMDFTYTFDGIHLQFKPVADPAKDPCDGRKADFNDAKTWVLTQ